MTKMSVINRFILLALVLAASYAVITSGSSACPMVTWSFTVGFGILVIAGLLLIILGYPVLINPLVMILSTMIPLSFSMGLVAHFYPHFRMAYFGFVVVGLGLVIYTRLAATRRSAALVVAVVHGVSGLVLFGLPIGLTLNQLSTAGILWVSVGSLMIGVAGLLLTFLRVGAPLFPEKRILTIFPSVLLLTTITFLLGTAVI